ncbi:MAG: hypothetical protein EOP55_10595 [Sphingobacteriales bacterium]|nr:MAG: hypothetical protein EOP55_10595 [Sphingobacteriales bacterium]
MKTKFLFFALLFPVIVVAQQETKIRIKGVNPESLNVFYLSIVQGRNVVKVFYKIQNSLSSKVKHDPDYIALKEEPSSSFIETSTGTVNQKYSERLGSIFNRYYVYTIDSLKFLKSKNRGYSNLITKVKDLSMEKLPEDKRSFLDGTSFEIVVTNGKFERIFQLISPDKDYAPAIAQLITQTFNLFRKGKNDSYLTLKRTSGY